MKNESVPSNFSLGRGSGIVDLLLHKQMAATDLISIVAAYIAQENSMRYFTLDMSEHLGSCKVQKCLELFEMHKDMKLPLWKEGGRDFEAHLVDGKLLKRLVGTRPC